MLVSKKSCIFAAVVAILLTSTTVLAGDTPEEIFERVSIGNPIAGKEKSTLCQGCHGENGISIMPNIPNLAGQWGAYIMREIRDFWIGSRNDPIMSDMAGTVTSMTDAFDISAYFASQNQMSHDPISQENEEGKRLYIIYRCISCHGEEGQGRPQNNPLFPVIGGQHKEYLIKQLDDFRTGLRDTDMSGTMPLLAKTMSAAETDAIAEYLCCRAAPTPVVAEVEVPVIMSNITAATILFSDKPLILEGANFVTDSAKLRPVAYKQLASLVEFAKKNSDPIINVSGHTDSTGTVTHNEKLSLARAESVKTYLIKQGIATDRINTKGEASNLPIADNKTISGRAKNRRVEILTTVREETKVMVSQ
jgi:outer membrane protein OmpA-like peptidoglycan-associated protein